MDYQQTQGQIAKLQRAAKKGCPASIWLSHQNLSGDHKMLLTRRQIQKIKDLLQRGKGGMELELSKTQMKKNMQKEGGFLPILAGLAMKALPMVAKTVLPALGLGSLSGLGGMAVNKALKKGGGACCVSVQGKGLYLRPNKTKIPETYGDGLYLKRGAKFVDGSGLILGPDSPFKNIPLLGMFL